MATPIGRAGRRGANFLETAERKDYVAVMTQQISLSEPIPAERRNSRPASAGFDEIRAPVRRTPGRSVLYDFLDQNCKSEFIRSLLRQAD